MNFLTDDQPGTAAKLGVEVLPNEQNVLNRGRTTLSKDGYACASLALLHLMLH